MLEVRELNAGYNRGEVLRSVSLLVPSGSIVGLLGPNGAGKTTLALSISGMTRISKGEIFFEGRSIAKLRPQQIVELGLVQVAQGRLLFRELTVEENLRIGARPRRARSHYKSSLSQVEAYFPVLAERRKQLAGLLSGGEQQMLAIARALMARPSLLVLDEPSLGLAPKVISSIFDTVRQLNSEGLTVLIAEQNARKVLAMANHVYVLAHGQIEASEDAETIRSSEALREAYLGITPSDKGIGKVKEE